MTEQGSPAQRRQDLAGRLWLSYYNRVLLEKKLISEREYGRMALKINAWKAPTL